MKKLLASAVILKLKLLTWLQGRPEGAVPDMTFMDAEGRPSALKSYLSGKSGGLLWMTNLCEGCREKVALFQKVFSRHGDRLGLVAVSTLLEDRESPARVRREIKFEFPLLEDPKDDILNVLGFAHPGGACPMFNLLLFDARRNIRFKAHLSAVKEAKLFEEIEKLLSGPSA